MSSLPNRVLHKHKPKKKGQLKLTVGEIVYLTKKPFKKGYCQGFLANNPKKIGIFPRLYVEQLDNNLENLEQADLKKIIFQGKLCKRRSKFQKWRKRYIKLYPRSLTWFKNLSNEEPTGLVQLKDCRILQKHSKKKQSKQFILQSTTKSWTFNCTSKKERDEWIKMLNTQIKTVSKKFQYLKGKRKNTLLIDIDEKKPRLQRSLSRGSLYQKREKTKIKKKKKINTLARSVTHAIFEKKILGTPKKRYKNKPTTKKKSLNTEIFGVPLQTVIQRDNSKIPKIILNSVKYLEKNGLKTLGIFRKSGYKKQIDQYKQRINLGENLLFENENNVHNVTGLLKLWFRELPETLLTSNLYFDFIKIQNEHKDKNLSIELKKLVYKLPELNRIIFRIISELCINISKHKSANKMDISNLALLFGPTLCSRRGIYSNDVTNMQKECIIVSTMFKYYDFIFRNKEQFEELFIAMATKAFTQNNNQENDQLYFNEGDIISVLNTDDQEFWFGTLISNVEGKNEKIEQGFFPSNYVEKISEEELLEIFN
ncbi:rho/rac/cdc gtpase-activating protein [Anaeramoeba flamelloides]|uniref:Rho/rac/cdc gtpase-activating protein n=1 Tax=Anaeramoeba flamelloides TaxID=1746091 RepID=A0AAV7ZPA2_9EUKA|nr:rho/rac/cdc gtpase-activating protein [Anaeramoeba flamelloides]